LESFYSLLILKYLESVDDIIKYEHTKYKDTVHQLFIDFKKAYDSVRREVLYNILIKFGVPMKLVRLIKTCLNET
jgi:purine nucleoside phosphorylase